MQALRIAGLLFAVSVFVCSRSSHAAAETIRLKDGDEFSATILRKDPEEVTVALPRQDVEAIDGHVLGPPIAPVFAVPDVAGMVQTVPDPSAVIVLQFWATWCPHCRSDIGLLNKLSTKYQGKGLRVVSVSVDQDAKALGAFVEANRLAYPVIAAYSKAVEHAQLPEHYETHGIPAYFIIDRDGVIVKQLSGSITETKKDLEGLLRPLLASER